MGFVMPAVRILDNVQSDANTSVIKIKEVEAGSRQQVFRQPRHDYTRTLLNAVPVPGRRTTSTLSTRNLSPSSW